MDIQSSLTIYRAGLESPWRRPNFSTLYCQLHLQHPQTTQVRISIQPSVYPSTYWPFSRCLLLAKFLHSYCFIISLYKYCTSVMVFEDLLGFCVWLRDLRIQNGMNEKQAIKRRQAKRKKVCLKNIFEFFWWQSQKKSTPGILGQGERLFKYYI